MLIHKHKHSPPFFQGLSSWSSVWVGLGSLSQELRVHLNHWSCLSSKVQSDNYLRRALVQQTQLLVEIKQTLDSLSLQALVLMEQYVYVILSATAQTDLNSVPREVLEDIVAGTDLYNQAVEEQRAQRCATQLRTAVLQQAQCSIMYSSLPTRKRHHPAAFSVKELTMILAVHQAEMAAKQLHCWASTQSYQMCTFHNTQKTSTYSDKSIISCGSSALRSEWTWEKLHTYLNSSSLLSVNKHPTLHSSSYHTCYKTPCCIEDLHLDSTVVENHHPVLAKSADKNQTSQCQTYISQSGVIQTSEDALDSVHPHLERVTDLKNCKLLHTDSSPSTTSHHRSALLLSDVCQLDHSSAELLFQLLASSSDLLAPLVSHTPTPEAPPKQLLPNTITNTLSPCGKNESVISTATIINTADPVEVNKLSMELNKDQNVDGTQQEWAELEITTRPEAACR